jgi:peptidoglycan/xylan/chitin deacetylase (PgdA/CDA1 family)
LKERSQGTRSFVLTSLTIAISVTVLTIGLAACAPATAAAPNQTIVSLSFDDGTISQYTLAWQRTLAPHGMSVTFFVPTGKIGSGPDYMTWGDLSTLFAAGNEIGGHTVHHVDLTSPTVTDDQKVHEVCDDRQALLQHGLDAKGFAYPDGAYDQTAQRIVRDCGYTSARAAGGTSANGSIHAESIPPLDAYATRTWSEPTPPTSAIQLSDMQAFVNAAASHGGGWVQIGLHRVCSQTYDPANYRDCLNSWRPMELDTLNDFLGWMAAAGQRGGAPAGSAVRTIRQALDS